MTIPASPFIIEISRPDGKIIGWINLTLILEIEAASAFRKRRTGREIAPTNPRQDMLCPGRHALFDDHYFLLAGADFADLVAE